MIDNLFHQLEKLDKTDPKFFADVRTQGRGERLYFSNAAQTI